MKSIQPTLSFLVTTVAVLIVCNSEPVNSARILSVAFVSSKSHKITYQPLLHELGRRGHEVTSLTPIPAGNPVKNVREILTKDFEAEFKDSKIMPNMFEMKENGTTMNPFLMFHLFEILCRQTYQLPHVQKLMKEKFDLIILQPLFNDCALGFVHHFNTSLIFISPISAPPLFTTFTGLPALPSFIPNIFLPFTDKMSYGQRMMNFAASVALTGVQELYWKPKMAALYREELGDPNLPGVNEILGNVSLILSNAHFSMTPPKPFLPDTIDVGGMHCHPAQPLPKDLDDFVNSSGEDGFIYFSMGTAIPAHTMPEKYRLIFINTFAKLKQKVLWKWETETMADLPKNVKLGKWFPQQDVLGHPKIRMFITHGGFGGTTEAVYHGVALLGFPMMGDQHLNMEKSENSGFALSLEFTELSEEKLTELINRILQNNTYHERAKALSKIFRDQVDKPLDRAVFWTEYILRHKGALHMRSAGRELNFFQYHSIDVIASYCAILLVILYVLKTVVKFIFRKICGSKKSTTTKAQPLSTSNKKRN